MGLVVVVVVLLLLPSESCPVRLCSPLGFLIEAVVPERLHELVLCVRLDVGLLVDEVAHSCREVEPAPVQEVFRRPRQVE